MTIRHSPHKSTPADTASIREAFTRQAVSHILHHTPSLLYLTLYLLVLYSAVFIHPAFGPEFAAFYRINAGLSFVDILHKYIEFGAAWYRPTAFYLPYWVAATFIGWHHIMAWRFLFFITLLAACCVLYILTILLFPGHKLAALLACIYFASHPGIYAPLFELSAFDFPHIFFSLLTIILFTLAYRTNAAGLYLLNVLGVLTYVAALTAKETTLVIPIYLAIACILYAYHEPKWRSPKFIRRGVLFLIPYFLVLALFLAIHVSKMPARPADSAYRTKANVAMILENARKYPMWVARFFQDTGDTLYQANEQTTGSNQLFAAIILIVVLAQWSRDLHNKAYRLPGLLLSCWILIFLTIPIYSGGYLWHSNLALCGYAVLVGVGISRFSNLFKDLVLKNAYIIGFLLAFLWIAKTDVNAMLHNGVHATAFRINQKTIFLSPPVRAAQLGQSPLIYVEDRLALGSWNYGAGHLFALTYLNPNIEEVIVPKIDQVPGKLCLEWLDRRNAVFFQYDDRFAWHDASDMFKRYALSQVTSYTNSLFSMNRGKDVAALLSPIMMQLRNDGIAHYHYALSLQMLGRTNDALAEYAKAIDLMPKLFFAFYNRGHLYVQTQQSTYACSDFRRARVIDPRYPGIDALTQEWCASVKGTPRRQ